MFAAPRAFELFDREAELLSFETLLGFIGLLGFVGFTRSWILQNND